MPFTFVAQQAPILRWSQRHPERWDGVALVVGTMAPDLAYLTRGWFYGPLGIQLWFDGHRLQNVLVLSLGSALLALLVRRVVLPITAVVVPDAGVLHLHDYRFIAERRPRWWVTYWSCLAGSLLHLCIDVFLHPDEPVIEHLDVLRAAVVTIGDHPVRTYEILDVASTAVLAIIALRWVVQVGRQRAFVPEVNRPMPTMRRAGRALFWAIVGLGVAAAVAYGAHRARTFGAFARTDTASVVIAFSWVAFGGLVAACVAARPFVIAPDVGGWTNVTDVPPTAGPHRRD